MTRALQVAKNVFQPQVPLKTPRRNLAAALVQGGKAGVHRQAAVRCWAAVVCYMVSDTFIAGVTAAAITAAASSKTASTISGTSGECSKGSGSTQPPADTPPASSSSPSGEVLGGGGMLHGA